MIFKPKLRAQSMAASMYTFAPDTYGEPNVSYAQ
jgi:hypothetical protein